MINCIDTINDDNGKLFTCGHFDLVICDEAHRSIYNKYKDIFTYFDAPLVGLTATPKDEIDKNTYEVFELEKGVPTYGYDLAQAVKDGYLVDYVSVESKLKFIEQGIVYDELSEEDREEYEETFEDENGRLPEAIGSSALNTWIFNEDTIKKVLNVLMTEGIKIDYGQKLGKTIIFAKNHDHAEKILEIFNKEYPYLPDYAKVIDNYMTYAQSAIDEFSDAKLSGGVESLYTEEAFLLCKRYEFKNMLSRFNVEAPKNNAEEHFVVVRDLKTAESVFEKAKDKEVAFAVVPGESLGNSESDGQLSLFSEPASNDYLAVSICFSEEDIYFICTGDEISSSFLDEKLNTLEVKSWISPDLKTNLHRFKSKEIKADDRGRYFDMMVAAYLINPLVGEYPYDAVAKDYLGLMLSSKKDYLGKLDFTRMMKEDEKKAVDCACYEVYTAWKSKPVLLQKLKEMDMLTLYKDIELPLVFVLYDMENEGIRADGIKLKEYGDKLAVSITELEKKIYEAAGEEFNINSPKQLGVILFEKLGLPNEKKTKTGYSTAADVLEKLAPEYPIVADILEYRQLTKLKSTYADGLSGYIASDGKIHTTLNQTITATGRLSSTEPNLQNIPIRIELGKLIRKVFLPEDGDLFVDSDYSQIELRVLAALSGDERMIEAFKNGQDIHRSTASLVFDTPFDEVTDLQRRNAKAVNFGIVYGISAFGLSNDLGISRKEAQGYIDSYFVKYPKIKEFLDQTVLDAKKNGYTKTMFGRIRPIPELNSSNFMQRQFGERVAMNSPIQGTAADIIKIAMIRVHDRLLDEGLKSRLILQVHDELLIETKEAEKDKVIKLLEKEMRGAVNMKVSMEVGTECGYDWYDAH